MEERNICGYCGQTDSKELYPTYDVFGHNYTIHQCNNCNAYFLAPRPDAERLAQAYDVSYYGEQEEKFSNPMVEKVLDYFRMGRARRLSKYLKEGDNILDIGCGNGRFLLYLLNFGKYNLFGTELDGNSAKRTARISEIDLRIGGVESAGFEPETFDAITLFHVFEHLANPKEVLEVISKIIKPNGTLVMSFPNIESTQSKWFKGKWLHLDPPRHLFLFGPKEFMKLMEGFGFEVVNEHYISSEQNPYGMVQSLLNLFYKKREVLFESLKGNEEYTKEYSKLNILFQKGVFALTFPFFIITDVLASPFRKGATMEFTFKKVK